MKRIFKINNSILLIVLFFVFGLFTPRNTFALVVSDPGAVIQRQAIATGEIVRAEVKTSFWEEMTHAGMGALMNGITNFVKKITRDAAIYIGTGGKGEGALIYQNDPGKYFLEASGDAVGEAIGNFSSSAFGINICKIPDPRLNVKFQLGLEQLFGVGGGKSAGACSWQDLKNSWGDIENVLEERYGPGMRNIASEVFNAELSVEGSDFGIGLASIAEITKIKALAEENARIQRIIGEGVKDVKSAISGYIVTPSHLLKKEIEMVSISHNVDFSASQVAGVYASGLYLLPATAAITFISTLAEEGLKRLKEGLFPEPVPSVEGSGNNYYAKNIINRKKQIEQAFNYLRIPSITQIDNYPILSEYSACPEHPGLNNCVIEQGMRQAIERASRSTPFTIRDAMKEGLIHSEWLLISPRRNIDNTNVRECYINKYCYSNIQKLRKIRVLPLGFEIAALKSDPDNPWTLGDVVDGFNDCNAEGESDSEHPYCHLIDPNWVIKITPVRVATEVYGPILQSSISNVRKKERVDIQTCVARGVDGECASWGYCTREQNTWIMPGGKCPSYYTTCSGFRNRITNEATNYLKNTLDYGMCDEASTGCLAFVTERVNGNFVRVGTSAGLSYEDTRLRYKLAGRAQVLNFNNKVETCSPTDVGCTALYGADRGGGSQFSKLDLLTNRESSTGTYRKSNKISDVLYLKVAPADLGCYDTDPTTPQTERPVTRQEAISRYHSNSRCASFAPACVEAEVGCNKYTDKLSGEVIPGVVRSANFCNSLCLGYDTFKQERSNFEAEKFPLYFIPKNGASCSEFVVGCDAFTNIDEASAGGERVDYFSYLRYCEKPTGTNSRPFFSWEGSLREGFVLRRHQLLQISTESFNIIAVQNTAQGNRLSNNFPVSSPAYDDMTFINLERQVDRCDEDSYNLLLNNPSDTDSADPDCRALFDERGDVYYRIFADTVFTSNQCLRLRKNESLLEIDRALTAATTSSLDRSTPGRNHCTDAGGAWADATPNDGVANPVCQRCFAGGKYQGGSCVYNALPSMSLSCRASADRPDKFVGCREYTGNISGDRHRAVDDYFETSTSTVAEFWPLGDNVRLVSESLHTGQKSLLINVSSVSRIIATNTLVKNGQYELSFWARSSVVQNLDIYFYQRRVTGGTVDLVGTFTSDSTNNTSAPVTIGQEWREYRVGPAQFVGESSTSSLLRFERTGGGQYFIDNVRLERVKDKRYLIKNSWKVNVNNVLIDAPRECFAEGQNPLGEFPGYALGCREYRDEDNKSYNLTGFTSLCREEAIGCEPLFESHNTLGENASNARAYSLWCSVGSGIIASNTCTVSVGTSKGECTIERGKTGCYVRSVILPTDKSLNDLHPRSIVTSTVLIQAETATPIYLVNRAKYRCRDTALGCTEVGYETDRLPGREASYSYQTVYLKNNPKSYDSQLCYDEQIGCSAYSDDTNNYYFKDPLYTGKSTCSYKKKIKVGVGTEMRTGWFKDGVGVCSNSSTSTCREARDCTGGGTCDRIGTVACYDNFINSAGGTGIWNNATPQYEGFVGVCTAEMNRCTEFLDPADHTFSSRGKSYYRIDDEELRRGVGDCGGQVSQKEGCVLFDKTDQPNKSYNTTETYLVSSQISPQYGFVDPLSGTPNDANLILKVNRDRICGEWLACQSYIVKVEDDGRKTKLCTRYKACNVTIPGVECLNFVDSNASVGYLDESTYTGRDVSWYGQDFSGYSILNNFQISDMTSLSFSDDERLYVAYNEPVTDAVMGCKSRDKEDGTACGVLSRGRCFKSRCVYPITGNSSPPLVPDASVPSKLISSIDSIKASLLRAECKGFPEESSPYPNYISRVFSLDTTTYSSLLENDLRKLINDPPNILKRNNFPIKAKGFEGVNVCQDGDCSCSYVKYTYSSGDIDYYSREGNRINANQIPKGICSGGKKEGFPCEQDIHCDFYTDNNNKTQETLESKGICQYLKKKETNIGLLGFCLEKDFSRPINGRFVQEQLPERKNQDYACLTWLPIQTSASNIDLFNQNNSSGYDPNLDAKNGPNGSRLGGEVMCVSANASLAYSRYILGVDDPPNVDLLIEQKFADSSGRGRHGFYPYFTQYGEPRIPTSAAASAISGSGGDGHSCKEYFTSSEINIFNYNINGSYHMDACNALSPWLYYTIWGGNPTVSELNSLALYHASRLAKSMQIWAWRELGKNSVLLRQEYRSKNSTIIGLKESAPHTVYWTGPPMYRDATVDEVNTAGSGVYRTSPLLLADKLGMMLPFGLLSRSLVDNNAIRSSLSAMHPPRDWRDGSDPILSTYHYGAYRNVANWNPSDQPPITTIGLSPDSRLQYGYTSLSGDSQPNVIITPDEGILKERDIDQVFFVPTIFPSGFYTPGSGWWWSPMIGADKEYTFRLKVAELRRSLESTTDNGASLDFFPMGGVRVLASDVNNQDINFPPSYHSFVGHDPVESREYFAETESSKFAYHPQAMHVWNYVLQNDKSQTISPLLSYDNYDVNPFVISTGLGVYQQGLFFIPGSKVTHNFAVSYGSLLSQKSLSRNYIARRYVTVFFYGAPGVRPDFAPPSRLYPIPTPSIPGMGALTDETGALSVNDPFTARCHPNRSNWMAIGMDFNDGGEFLGYITRVCTLSTMPFFSVFATIANKCTDFVKVYDEDNIGSVRNTNKAWTQRVWAGSTEGAGNTGLIHPDGSYLPELTSSILLRPFGSISLTGDALGDSNKEKDYIFDSPLKGMPYSCTDSIIPGLVNSSPDCSALRGFGYPNDLISMLMRNTPVKTKVVAEGAISLLFVEWYGRRQFVAVDRIFRDGTVEDKSARYKFDVNTTLTVPRVYSLNPALCLGDSNTNTRCLVGEPDNVTVSGKNGTMKDYDQDELSISDEDVNRDGEPDYHLSRGSFVATLNFFAVADDNRMPIRKVEVDWGDDSGMDNDGKYGYYQNRKPFCSKSDGLAEGDQRRIGLCRASDYDRNTRVSMLTCRKDSDCPPELLASGGSDCILSNTEYNQDINNSNARRYQNNRFGNSERACVENYFEFVHVYNCSQFDVNNQLNLSSVFVSILPVRTQQRIKAVDEQATKVCIFKPRVRITDNWGYCTGTCQGTNNGGCYDDSDGGQCSGTTESKSFIEYRGSIIVIPLSTTTLQRAVSREGEDI